MTTPGTSPIALAGEVEPSGTLQLGPRGTQIGNIPTSRRWQHPPVVVHPDHAPVNTIGRYWIFPDDWRFMINRDASDFVRNNWPTFLYSPFNQKQSGLVLIDSAIGGGILDAGDWVPRRRPFGDTIGRIRESGDRAPIVRFNFKATDPRTAIASV